MTYCSDICFLFSVPIQMQAKDSRSVLSTAVPTGSKAPKPQTVKTAGKGKKQGSVKKNDGDSTTGTTEDKGDKTKPQVTHELSMVSVGLCLCKVKDSWDYKVFFIQYCGDVEISFMTIIPLFSPLPF